MIVFPGPRRKAHMVIWPLILLLSGCGAPRCQPGSGEAMQIYTLYFGRSVTNRAEVSDKEWRDFRDQVLSPALPNGYTVLDGHGAWMNPSTRVTISETTKIVVVALPDVPGGLSVISYIRSNWQHRFHQYVVGMTVQTGCGSFSPAEAPR
jgi:hypothetical protein